MLRIVKDKAKSLHSPSKEVASSHSAEEKALLDEMLAYLKFSQDPAEREKNPKMREGVGLAAPQVGVNKRMLVIYYPINEERKPNLSNTNSSIPKIVISSIKKCYLTGGEGCLSVDEPHPGRVYRDFRIQVKAYNALVGENVSSKPKATTPIVLQHEIDHLDGILFYDHIDPKDPEREIPGSISAGFPRIESAIWVFFLRFSK
jgi:peptide deformylase